MKFHFALLPYRIFKIWCRINHVMLITASVFLVLQGLQSTKRDAYGRLILGDIITSVNGKKVANGSDLYRILDQCKVGDTVSVNSYCY